MENSWKKTVGELRQGENGKPYRFYVPAYQRGYRWDERQVTDLLRDLIEFKDAKENGAVEGQYCLQPLIVKKRQDGSYEVVDGQQRLTTIAIFKQVFHAKFGDEEDDDLFSIKYETRADSEKFLAKLGKDDEQAKNEKGKNIDYHYMWQAYQVMKEFARKSNQTFATMLTELKSPIENSAFFIWYEIDENTNEIELFQRVNMGKISLTNAELIKGVFFRDQNYTNTTMASEQFALANSWQRIEHGLENDAFWYFFNGIDKSYETRLDVLFHIIAQQEEAKDKVPKTDKAPKDVRLYAFHIFDDLFRSKKDQAERATLREKLWAKVERLNAQLHYWYDNLDYYHIIGYLLATGTGVQKILDLIDGKKKSQQIDDLMALVKDLKIKKENLIDTFLENPEAIEYDSNNKAIANLLLLFNIATLVVKGERQHRFPFDVFKKEKWDIEHIHATADESNDADNRIHNLTLLVASTNRGVGNKPFLEKRVFLLKKEQEGRFIPTCTRNIFIKAYTDNPQGFELWDDTDKDQYIKKMQVILKAFFKIEQEGSDER